MLRRRVLGKVGRIIAISVLLTRTAAATEIPFEAHPFSESVDGPTAVAAADLDGDGDLDLVYAAEHDDAIRWRSNLGAGSFSASQLLATVASPVDLAVGDIDDDGDLDVVVVSSGLAGALVWLENDGSPTSGLWPARSIDSSVTPVAVALADIDADGDLDVLAASFLDDGIAWYVNDGAAVPSFAVHWVTRDADGLGGAEGECDTAADVLAADIDADGDLDLVTACHGNDRVAWHENLDGSGSFGAQQLLDSTLDGARYVLATDLDGDGGLDVLASGALDGRVTRYLQTPTGFTAPQVVAVHTGAATLAAADPDEDGDVDVLMGHADGVRWREHAGDLGFRTLPVDLVSGGGPRAAVWADLDGDGDLDVLVARYDGDNVAWYENRTIGASASFSTLQPLVGQGEISQLAAVDLDGDGDVDLLAAGFVQSPASPVGPALLWSANDGAGNLAAQQRLVGLPQTADAMAIGDLDGDGDPDVVVSSAYPLDRKLRWCENLGGALAACEEVGAPATRDVRVVDVDGDGDLDLVATQFADEAVLWYPNTDGAGTFGPPQVALNSESRGDSLAVADFDRDGDPDIVARGVSGPIVWVAYEGPGFGLPQEIHVPATDGRTLLEAADLDGDGWSDFVAFFPDFGGIQWFRNLGGGSFAAPVVLGAFSGLAIPADLGVVDLDSDGDLDLVVGERNGDRVAWLVNDGAATPSFAFELVLDAGAGGPVEQVVAADFDGDGDVDLAYAGPHVSALAWWPNVGGQYRLAATDTAQEWLGPATHYELFRLELEHLGRGGDEPLELGEIVLLIESGEGSSASTGEILGTFEDFDVWQDDGDGIFDPTSDVERSSLWQIVGAETRVQTPGLAVGATSSATLWLTGTTTANPSMALRVTERESRRTLRHPDSDPLIRLRGAAAIDTTTGWLDPAVENGCQGPYELEIFGLSLASGTLICEAGTDLSARDGVEVGAPASLVLRAGRTVQLGDGFSIGSGGSLLVEILPTLLPDG